MNLNMHESIYIAIQDYKERHNSEKPAKIVMSKNAFMKALNRDIIDFRSFPETYMGIPLSITFEGGVHIHLCEPDIHLFPEENANTIKIKKENTDE